MLQYKEEYAIVTKEDAKRSFSVGKGKKTWKNCDYEDKDFPEVAFFQRINQGKVEAERQELIKGATSEKQWLKKNLLKEFVDIWLAFLQWKENFNHVHMYKV